MSELVDRLARELALALGYPPTEAPRMRRPVERLLAAARDPSTEMVRAGRELVPDALNITKVWQAMIDAARLRP
jgi:hypothetical protein